MDILLTTITVVLFTVVVVVGIWTVCILIINHDLGRELKRMSDEIDEERYVKVCTSCGKEKKYCFEPLHTGIVWVSPIYDIEQSDLKTKLEPCIHGVRPLTKEAKEAMKTAMHKSTALQVKRMKKAGYKFKK